MVTQSLWATLKKRNNRANIKYLQYDNEDLY